MQSSLIFLPGKVNPPAVGDEIPVELRLTTATVDRSPGTDARQSQLPEPSTAAGTHPLKPTERGADRDVAVRDSTELGRSRSVSSAVQPILLNIIPDAAVGCSSMWLRKLTHGLRDG